MMVHDVDDAAGGADNDDDDGGGNGRGEFKTKLYM